MARRRNLENLEPISTSLSTFVLLPEFATRDPSQVAPCEPAPAIPSTFRLTSTWRAFGILQRSVHLRPAELQQSRALIPPTVLQAAS